MNYSGNLMITINVLGYMVLHMVTLGILFYRTVGVKVMNWLDKKDQEIYGYEDEK